jgi:UDP:flavonoid glycosyltransferase YjiC (YdhE family)
MTNPHEGRTTTFGRFSGRLRRRGAVIEHHDDMKQGEQMSAARKPSRSNLLKAFSICVLSMYAVSSANACVILQSSGLQYLIMNYCQYPVITHYVASSGLTGATGSIPPGGSELTPIPLRFGLDVQWCKYTDWKVGRCKLPKD